MAEFVQVAAESAAVDLLVVPVDETLKSVVLETIGARANVDVLASAAQEHFKGKAGSSLLFRGLTGVEARCVLLVGTGEDAFRRAGVVAARNAKSVRAAKVAIAATGLSPQAVAEIVQGMTLGAYEFKRHISSAEDAFIGVQAILVLDGADAEPLVREAKVVGDAVLFARDLVNESPNNLYPASLAEAAVDMATKHGLQHVVFDEGELQEKGFNLIMAVGKGSEHAPRLIHLTYSAGKPKRRIALVGKGVTFDTGGYNIKPGASMLNMHGDMGGGAAVLGAAQALAQLAPTDIEVHFIVPSAENNIAANAYKPNDIFHGYGGKSVEIHNTDAEGRLLLADALAYAKELGVDTIVDLATLTGACVVALGELTAGLFTNDDALAEELLAASKRADEDLWRLPLTAKLDTQLDTPHADMKNIGSRWGGAITAGLFLKRWVDIEQWAHLDIAGPAFSEHEGDLSGAGGTGYGVTTLVEFVRALSA